MTAKPARPPTLGIWALCLLFLQFLFGAYVAGLEAGYAFNTWPLMGDEFFPAATPMLEPWPRNLVDNPIVVQFVHRWLAFLVAGFAIWVGVRAWRRGIRVDGGFLIAAVFGQLLLGILTILSGVQIDIAVAHQGMAALAARRAGRLRPPPRAAAGMSGDDRLRLRRLRLGRRGARDRPGDGRATARRLRQHPGPLPLDLPLAGRDRGGGRGRRPVQDAAATRRRR